MDNEKIKIYIEDLLKENKTLFAMNEDVQERRKALKNELLLLCDSYGSEEDMKIIELARIIEYKHIFFTHNYHFFT